MTFFSVDYYYNNNKRMTARQIDGCDGNVSEQVYEPRGWPLNDRGEIKIVDYNGNTSLGI